MSSAFTVMMRLSGVGSLSPPLSVTIDAEATTETSVTLSWDPGSDDRRIDRYKVYEYSTFLSFQNHVLRSPPIWKFARNLYGQLDPRFQDYDADEKDLWTFIMLHQAGFTQAVATLGTALTSEHLPLLRKGEPRILMAYDGDAADDVEVARAAGIVLDELATEHCIYVESDAELAAHVDHSGGGALRQRSDSELSSLDGVAELQARPRPGQRLGRVHLDRELAEC